jgi:hypothetical protein
MLLTYTEFITISNYKTLRMQYKELTEAVRKTYYLYAYDWNEKYEVIIDDSSEVTNFETNYKNSTYTNKPIITIENETGLWRVRNRDVEGTLAQSFVYCITGDEESLDSSKYYTVSTSTGTSTGVTKVLFSPILGYYITGGGLKLLGNLTERNYIKVGVTFAPNFPQAYGGNWKFVINKKFTNDFREFEATVPSKFIKYYSYYPTASEVEFSIEHHIDERVELELHLKTYIAELN